MTQNAEQYYKDYWVGAEKEREKRLYYQRLYGQVRDRLKLGGDLRVLDVAGGNGQLMRYLGMSHAEILDISESGLAEANRLGHRTVHGDIQARFPVPPDSYDAAYLFEVLEHLPQPNKTLVEIQRALKPDGILFVGQPNMRADGVHHVRRYYLRPLLEDLRKCGFRIDWVDFVPAYSMPDSIVDDIFHNPSRVRKAVQCVNWMLSRLPRSIRYAMACAVPDRFALIFIVKAIKE